MTSVGEAGYPPLVNDVFTRLSEEPILLAILVFLLGGLAYGLMRKVLKLAFIFVLGVLVLGGYFFFTGKEPPEAMRRIAEEAGQHLERGAEIGKEKARRVGEKLGEKLKDKNPFDLIRRR